MDFVNFATQTFSILTIIGQLMILSILFGFLTKNKSILPFYGKRVLLFSFGVALICVVGSLFYSEVAHFEPCKFCWIQRIFIYPQAILFGVALWKRKHEIIDYSITLALIGAFVSLYHYLLQVGLFKGNCNTVGYSVTCTKRFVMTYGYITIPMMALTASSMIIAFGLAYKSQLKTN